MRLESTLVHFYALLNSFHMAYACILCFKLISPLAFRKCIHVAMIDKFLCGLRPNYDLMKWYFWAMMYCFFIKAIKMYMEVLMICLAEPKMTTRQG